MRKCVMTLTVLCLLFATVALATAQDAATVREIFAAAPKNATSVEGVSIFAAPPKGFNPLAASGEELARYGLPQRPDQQAEPQRYARWERAMTALTTAKYHPVDVKAMPWHSSPMKLANRPESAATALTVSNVPITVGSGNWSGVANFNKLTKWNAKTSFSFVESLFVVPSAYTPINACANGITGPFLTSIWNGIDGYNNGDVIQGGIQTYSDCGGAKDNSYVAWVEWAPSYPELSILCSSTAYCPVTPGDSMLVQTYGVAGTATQTVFVENVSQNWSGTFSLAYVSGPGLVGSSEEQIVERPCCTTAGSSTVFYALNNYDYAYFADAFGNNNAGIVYFVGEQTASTSLLDMYDDAGDQIISEPLEQGSTGNAGKYMLSTTDSGCAYSGGCTP
jgi:Peptidase A4 family